MTRSSAASYVATFGELCSRSLDRNSEAYIKVRTVVPFGIDESNKFRRSKEAYNSVDHYTDNRTKMHVYLHNARQIMTGLFEFARKEFHCSSINQPN